MSPALLSALTVEVGACPGLRSYLSNQSAREFAAWLRRPRLRRIIATKQSPQTQPYLEPEPVGLIEEYTP